MTSLLHDLRFAARSLHKSPGFTIAAVLTLALGISATTVIFSAVNRVLLHPLPFKGGDRMVYAMRGSAKSSFSVMPSAGLVEAWRQNAHSFETMEAYRGGQFYLDRAGEKTRVSGMLVSPTFLSFLGLAPAHGRMFAADEAKPGGAPVVLLGYGFWQREFGGRADVLGRRVTLDDLVYTIIGVMPKRIALFEEGDVWMPLRPRTADGTIIPAYSVVARLRPGITAAQAQQELTTIGKRLPTNPNAQWEARVVSPRWFMSKNLRSVLPILLGAVGFVLLIACANVALLLLARGAARERELAIRLSLGAGRRRLVWQLMTESVLVVLCGGALGLLLTWWGVDVLAGLRPESLSDLAHVGIDVHVLLFALGLSVLSALLVGIVPALRATDVALGSALRSGEPGSGAAAASGRLRSVLVAGEMMLSIVLLVGAGLLVRSLAEIQHADLGFRAGGLVTMGESLSKAGYPTTASRVAFINELLQRARALPGVAGATIAMSAPPQYGFGSYNGAEIEGRGRVDAPAMHPVGFDMVRPEYFRTLGIRIVEGRSFTEAEDRSDAPVVILSVGMANAISPGRSLVGERVRWSPQDRWETVIGIAEDVAASGIRGNTRHMQTYSPYGDGPQITGGYLSPPGMLIVRTTGDAATLVPLLRGLVHSMDPNIPAPSIATVSSWFAEQLAAPRFNTILLGCFAALALVLAAIGLFGVLSYAVARRTREIGIRVALGAPSRDVRALVVRQGMLPALVGLALGAVAALFATRILAGLLYGVAPRDVTAFVVAGLLLTATALAACYLPARRATRVDPMTALRSE